MKTEQMFCFGTDAKWKVERVVDRASLEMPCQQGTKQMVGEIKKVW